MFFASLFLLAIPDDISAGFKQVWEYINYPYRIGNISVSLTSFVTGVAVFALALAVSRTFRVVIQRRIAKRTHIDPGLQYTIVRLVHYLIITLGVIYGAKAAFALDLTSIAVVFTALSVGIGFGLQYIAADIASGFILLFERPVKVGDRVIIGEDEGDVQSINLRTTIVLTNDRTAVIVPNSKLISQRLVNWSYGDPRTRIEIPVNVAHGSDAQLVKSILLEAAQGVENILNDPKASVNFKRFGETSLEFRLFVWTASPRTHALIASDVLFRVEGMFRDRGIVRTQTAKLAMIAVPAVEKDVTGDD
ncbi:MAG: hypothetical protein QOH96_3923 [Blastocatellia bacterium]|jgi:small-conductance mechanosensitive channel|nr:hypothetical protein [Blastocatellia bacterium]